MIKTIFVVEDDANLRFVFRVILESRGYSVRLFEDGDSLLTTDTPDLYILDNQLAGKQTGLAISRQLKKDKDKAATPVIIISGNESIRQEALTSGAALFLRKPIQMDELVSVVSEIVKGQEN
jgi:DNA-binding response OmpR family regulator